MNEKEEKCEIEDKAENGSQYKSEYGEAKRKEDNSEYGGGSNEHKVPELDDEQKKYYSYDSDGTLVYTDPASGAKYVLSKENAWVPKDGDSSSKKSEDGDAKKDGVEFDGKNYIHKSESGQVLRWNGSEWVKQKSKDEEDEEEEEEEEMSDGDDSKLTEEERKAKAYRKRRAQPGWNSSQGREGAYLTDPDTGAKLYRDPKDGMLYEWDAVKNAWFPRIDEDFMAHYQMNYGFTKDGKAEPTKPEEKPEEEVPAKKAKKDGEGGESAEDGNAKKKEKAKPQWFDEESTKSTKVYVSGMPEDVTEEEFEEFMTKCGMIDVDIRSNKPKIKLYVDKATNKPKGDGLCTYVKIESVQLALQILDGADFRGDGKSKKTVTVERAKFEMKGQSYDPKLKPKKLRKKEVEALKKKHDKMFAWVPEKMRGQRSKRDKIIVIKNLFEPSEFDKDPSKILEYTDRLRTHCAKFGRVGKVVLYDKHSEGVAQVFFSSPEEADQAVAMLDGRLFSGEKPMKAETWDGKTKYKVTETAEEEAERLANWDKFLLGEDEDEDKKNTKEKAAEPKKD